MKIVFFSRSDLSPALLNAAQSNSEKTSTPAAAPDTNMPFLSVPAENEGTDFKRGYLCRKSTKLPEGKKSKTLHVLSEDCD